MAQENKKLLLLDLCGRLPYGVKASYYGAEEEREIWDEIEVILGDYEFVLKDGKTYFVKKKSEYPRTYEECCKVLGKTNSFCFEGISLDEVERIRPFIKLLRCRDTYWKIVGEQMGLGKPWKPTWDGSESYYCIFCDNDEIVEDEELYSNTILAFPTKEMQDKFYNNFKVLIEECKELL